MPFGAKTVSILVKEIRDDPNMSVLDCTNNASVRMKSADALKEIAAALSQHKNIKQVLLKECEIGDDGAQVIGDLLRTNHVIEELVLEKNKLLFQY